MLLNKTICVYCGASPRVSEAYKTAAEEVGKALARAGYSVVYGGGQSGLMGIVADTALANGSKVIGIIPDHLDAREVRHEQLTELHVVTSMHERKAMMANRSDVFLILPGGLGTMDEFFEILTWKQLGLHDKTIIVYNIAGYWDNLKKLLDTIYLENFMKATDRDLYYVADNLADVMDKIEKAASSDMKINDNVL